jgi:hypothetical protein
MDDFFTQHLKDLIGASAGDIATKLARSLAALVKQMLSGNVNLEILPLLYGASLTTRKKKDGVIRPIAVGNSLCRLAGKARPTKLGYGRSG